MQLKDKISQIPILKSMYFVLSSINSYLNINLLQFFTDINWYIKDYQKLKSKKQNNNFYLGIRSLYPTLTDKTSQTPVEPIYFYQNSWAASKIFKLKPKLHVDVGSSVSMLGIISQFVPTTMVDIRPLPIKLNGLTFIKGSILKLPFKNNSLESVSSICVIEHIGLGRYGDKLDNFGSEKAILELSRVVKKNGHLIITVPIDDVSKVYFNAHRAFSRDHILSLFSKKFELQEEKYIYGYSLTDKYDKAKGFGTGLYLFRKK